MAKNEKASVNGLTMVCNKFSTALQQVKNILELVILELKMLKPKSKIKLSENLKMGVAGPTSQSTFFKYGGVFFLILSLYLAQNIYKQFQDNGTHLATSANLQQKVLGAYDQASGTDNTSTTQNASNINYSSYKVQKGDTIFGIAQTQHVGWEIIATLNKLKSPYTLHIGQALKLPPSPQNQN